MKKSPSLTILLTLLAGLLLGGTAIAAEHAGDAAKSDSSSEHAGDAASHDKSAEEGDEHAGDAAKSDSSSEHAGESADSESN